MPRLGLGLGLGSLVGRPSVGSGSVAPSVNFWTFTRTSSNLTGFSVTTSPAENINIYWGDNSSNVISSGQTINHTYTS